ncbi:MAG TPA: acyltransferase [Chitinophagaceae bacterium]|nr:acyltransferase [Chitinophagaceae bacterium]
MQQPTSAFASVEKEKVFFPNLDGLRFFSFFAVFLYHTYLTFFNNVKEHNPGTYSVVESLFQNGNLGVNFFFVLSGFLITFLLIKEKSFKGTIHVPNFYIRRILRIWPLFYLCLFIGFVVFPIIKQYTGGTPNEIANPIYYVFFANNFDFMHSWPVKPDATILSVLWSVAVEEQFYLTWPVILMIVPYKYYKYVFLSIMALSLVFRSFYTGLDDHDFGVRYFHTFSLIGDMAFGGLLAYYCSFDSAFRRFITNLNRLQIAMIYLGAITVSIFRADLFTINPVAVVVERLVIAFFYGMIIAEQCYAERSFFKMGKFKTISKLGIYTYGLYCLHLLGFLVADVVLSKAGMDKTSVTMAVAASVLAFVVSIVISLASYHLYEKWFLRLKDKFAFIVKK